MCIAEPVAYDAWYQTPRGRWIGECEYRLLRKLLVCDAGSSLLDVGYGTGIAKKRVEQWLPDTLRLGGFLAVGLEK